MKHIMNRLCVVATALAMSFGLSQCAKDNDAFIETPEGQVYVTLTASKGEMTKAELTDEGTTMTVTWSENDKLYVVGATDGLLGSLVLTEGNGETSGKFGGNINYLTSKQNIRFYYVGKNKSITDNTYTLSLASQAGTLDDIENTMHVMVGTLNNVAATTVNFGAVPMSNIISVVKVDTKTAFGEVSGVVVTGANATASIDLKTGTVTPATGNITLTEPATDSYYIALLPNSAKQVLKFTYNTHEANLKGKTIVEGKYFTNAGAAVIPLDGYCEEGFYYGQGIEINGVIWAPVNCGIGYDYAYPYGKQYQWGRLYGQTYEAGTITPESLTKASGQLIDNAGKFGMYESNGNWFSGEVDNTLWNGISKGTYDPCPSGWRVPTSSELKDLLGSRTSGELQSGSGVYSGMSGMYFDGSTSSEPTSGVFLPAAGCRRYTDGNNVNREDSGYYWSSSKNISEDGRFADELYFEAGNSKISYGCRAYGFSIRCVKKPIVPSDYIELNYLKSTTNNECSEGQYINTGYYHKNTTGFEVSFIPYKKDGWSNLFGSRPDDHQKELVVNWSEGANSDIHPYHKTGRLEHVANEDKQYDCKLTFGSLQYLKYINNVFTNSAGEESTLSVGSYTAPHPLYVFALYDNRYGVCEYAEVALHYLKLYEGTTLVRYYVPVRRKSDSVLGLYEAIENKFYKNEGTGSFTGIDY